MNNRRFHALFSSHMPPSAHSMAQRETSAPKYCFPTGLSPLSVRSSAKGKGTAVEDICTVDLNVHKRCVWFVDNHVDERPKLCRITAPHWLPNR